MNLNRYWKNNFSQSEMETYSSPVKFKIILLGEASVGKSSLTKRFCNGHFNQSNESTIGVAFRQKIIDIDDTSVQLECWDTAGQERFRSLVPLYFKKSHAIILVYDAFEDVNRTYRQTFKNLGNNWISQIKNHFPFETNDDPVGLYLVATKCDLLENRESDIKQIKNNYNNLKEEFKLKNLKLFITSSKSGEGITELFTTIAKDLLEKNDETMFHQSVFQLDYEEENTKPSWMEYCCGT